MPEKGKVAGKAGFGSGCGVGLRGHDQKPADIDSRPTGNEQARRIFSRLEDVNQHVPDAGG